PPGPRSHTGRCVRSPPRGVSMPRESPPMQALAVRALLHQMAFVLHRASQSLHGEGLRRMSKPGVKQVAGYESVRMFESDFLEKFSRVHPAVPALLYLPVSLASAVIAVRVQGTTF